MSTAGLIVHKAGPLATVQDGGRFGSMAWGVPVSGAADLHSLIIGNILCGNDYEEAGIECTMGGFEAEFLTDAGFAVTGAVCDVMVNGHEVARDRFHTAKQGWRLSIGQPARGVRSYLTLCGGVEVPAVLGSKSTYVKGGLGGFGGRGLKAGDKIETGKIAEKGRDVYILDDFASDSLKREPSGACLLRVTPGTMPERFSIGFEKGVTGGTYIVSPVCDRMGIRLDGPPIGHANGADIISGGIEPGAVQVPGSGQPIMLLPDRQTTGGYTKAFAVITADRSKLGQLRPGDKVMFESIPIEDAYKEFKLREERYKSLLGTERRPSVRVFRMSTGDRSYTVEVEEIP